MITETAAAATTEVLEVVGTTDTAVAIVWADGTFTTAAGTFAGGRREAKAAVRKAAG
jgi:hypothetical protein